MWCRKYSQNHYQPGTHSRTDRCQTDCQSLTFASQVSLSDRQDRAVREGVSKRGRTAISVPHDGHRYRVAARASTTRHSSSYRLWCPQSGQNSTALAGASLLRWGSVAFIIQAKIWTHVESIFPLLPGYPVNWAKILALSWFYTVLIVMNRRRSSPVAAVARRSAGRSPGPADPGQSRRLTCV